MTFLNSFKRLHKWLALLIGIQLIIWIVSGLVFSFIEHRNVGARFIYKNNQQNQIVQAENFVEVLKIYPEAIEINQLTLLGESVFKITTREKTFVVDKKSQQPINVEEKLITKIANENYRGGGKISQMTLVTELTDENRSFSLPSWQVIFDDQYESHIYFSAETGEYQGIRTESWRTFDFFMMLHFMDYGERGDFNNGLIIISALILVFFSMSGMLLIYSSFSIKDFIGIFNRFFGHKKFTVILVDENGKQKTLKIDKDERLMDALAENDIELDSACGGGGICGFCKVKLLSAEDKTMHESEIAEHDLLEEEELKQGYRLACQLSVDSKMRVEVPVDVLM